MPEKKPDRRTQKTRKALCEALAELLTEKELNKVTVQEIADKADVNRVTFYKHYLDVYDLYEKIEKDMLIEMGLLVLRLEELPPEQFFTNLLGYIDENRTVFRLLFSANGSGQMRSKFNQLLEGVFRKISAEKHNIKLSDPELEFRNCYRAHGCIAVIERWVQSGFSVSKDMIVKCLSELSHNTEKQI